MVNHAVPAHPVVAPPILPSSTPLERVRPVPRETAIELIIPDAVSQLHALATVGQIDEAIDYAARVCRATVGEFLAAPSPVGAPGLPWVELAVEFFVPPAVAETFASETDRALTRRSLEYTAARRSDQVQPLRLTCVPPGTFHQWRSVFKLRTDAYHPQRWSNDRSRIESLLHQARTGFREFPTA